MGRHQANVGDKASWLLSSWVWIKKGLRQQRKPGGGTTLLTKKMEGISNAISDDFSDESD